MSTMIELLRQSLELAEQEKVKNFHEINRSSVDSPEDYIKVEVDLTSGYSESRPFELPSFGFRFFWVYHATDGDCFANLVLHTKSIPQITRGLPIKLNVSQPFPMLVQNAYITAPAQPGKKLYIVLAKDGAVNPGYTISRSAGGIAVIAGDALTTPAKLTLTASPAKILDADPNLKLVYLRNMGPYPAALGASNVTDDLGANPAGLVLEVGERIAWNSQAETWGFGVGGTTYLARNVHK